MTAIGSEFKREHSLEDRKTASARMIAEYPNGIPIIVERAMTNIAKLSERQYMVLGALTMSQVAHDVVRRDLSENITPEQSLFLFVNDLIPPTTSLISQLYEEHRDEDGFLYIAYSKKNSLGANKNDEQRTALSPINV